MKYSSLDTFLNTVKGRDPNQPEFLQAVHEVMNSIWPFLEANPHYTEQGLLDRLVEPERVVQFRVAWLDEQNEIRVNRAWRVQHSSALGPFKGGMRFHPEVNLSALKFLAFEQTFKNALTTLPMGGGKGGSDFDPKGKSSSEIMRFCQALVVELFRHIGPHTDIPSGDIGVGAREVDYMAGMAKKLTNNSAAYFTGKSPVTGGSLMRPEATGYGMVYFVEEMLKHHKMSLEGMRVSISGSGNVAQHTIEKAMQLGAKVITVSDTSGTVHDPDGFVPDKLARLRDVKNKNGGRIRDYAEALKLEFLPDSRPWGIPTDVALPCAVQNELNVNDARTLLDNDVLCVGEGANMPTTADAVKLFHAAKVLFAPGKASNAGGVATSGLEMAQNAMLLNWPHDEVDQRLRIIMKAIHDSCMEFGLRSDGTINYVDGANLAAFSKVADAMLAQGVT